MELQWPDFNDAYISIARVNFVENFNIGSFSQIQSQIYIFICIAQLCFNIISSFCVCSSYL